MQWYRIRIGLPVIGFALHTCGPTDFVFGARWPIEEGRDMHWLWVIIIGFLAGSIAKLFISGPGGFVVTTLLGIVGAIFASWLGQRIGWYPPGHNAGFIGAIVGAVLILAIYRALFGRNV
jgi:uncharacterized membrane protein YeaQ/YmgE (transglycosylase-associated protein family)